MSKPILIRVIAPPTAPNACVNTWENAIQLIESKIMARYPGQVVFEFVPLFSRAFFEIPRMVQALQDGSAETPVILVNDRIVQSGGKISESKIRIAIEEDLNSVR